MAKFLRKGEGGQFICRQCSCEFYLRLEDCPTDMTHSEFGTGSTVRVCPFCADIRDSLSKEEKYDDPDVLGDHVSAG